MAYGLKKIKPGTEQIDVITRNGNVKIIQRNCNKKGVTKSDVISLNLEETGKLITLLNKAIIILQ